MPEYLALMIVTTGLVVLVAVLLIVSLNRTQQHMTSETNKIEQKLDALASRLDAIEGAYSEHGRDLDAIRSEYALHFSSQDAGDADYAQAIKAASNGVSSEEVSETYGLREAEAKLLVAVYGNR